ncbi:uncharacterized protein J3D65DRAFT_618203 [Phyllosticta citribraziliensis]|uniref:Rhodopsin domain-containing protein n=1 Tax=Phyllosticta citribraziliensis TaxID=989973 RepID=A0ABR1LVV8_9PEZI
MSRVDAIRIVPWVFTSLAVVAVCLRVYTRAWVVRYFWWDDVTVVVAMVLALGMPILWTIEIPYGLGRHLLDIPQEDWPVHWKLLWIVLFPYYSSLGFIKISVLLQCLRIFSIQRFRVACYILLLTVAIWTAWTIASAIITCNPVAYTWDKTISGGTCKNQSPILYTNAAVNIFTDFATIILPMPVLNKLSLDRRQKWLLMGIFAVGIFASITSILRLQSLVNADDFDVTYAIVSTCLWSVVEIDVGIICACLPAIRPLINRMCGELSMHRSWPSGSTPVPASRRGSSYIAAKLSHGSSRIARTDTAGFETLEGGETELERLPLSHARSLERLSM